MGYFPVSATPFGLCILFLINLRYMYMNMNSEKHSSLLNEVHSARKMTRTVQLQA